MNLEMVIGLEVHVQLDTQSKLFCGCPVAFGGEPNSRICPVCSGQPGVLPVLNERALQLAIRAGLALHCHIRQQTKFDRKNYFYPDLPKGYQISQFDEPVAEHGHLTIESDEGQRRKAQILRVHMEEDAGKSMHDPQRHRSLVDLNRAGVPLVEIVGEPDLCTPEEAGAYLTALRRTMRHAGVSDCDMEKGSMRCDANISVRPTGTKTLGTKVEIKNMNSIRNVVRALHSEWQRQSELTRQGQADQIVQETRSFRDDQGTTVSMRTKEQADDYRYFPDPDLPKFNIAATVIDQIRGELPEPYLARVDRYQRELELSEYDARVLAEELPLASWFEECLAAKIPAKIAANWIQGELLAFLKESGKELHELPVDAVGLGQLVAMQQAGEVSHSAAKKVFQHMLKTGSAAAASAKNLDLLQIQDDSLLESTVADVIATETKIVDDFRNGKGAALNALLGRVMRALKGKGDPNRIRELLQEQLQQ